MLEIRDEIVLFLDSLFTAVQHTSKKLNFQQLPQDSLWSLQVVPLKTWAFKGNHLVKSMPLRVWHHVPVWCRGAGVVRNAKVNQNRHTPKSKHRPTLYDFQPLHFLGWCSLSAESLFLHSSTCPCRLVLWLWNSPNTDTFMIFSAIPENKRASYTEFSLLITEI